MMIFKKAIPRRAFLRGVGATFALPLLDGMIPAFAFPGESTPGQFGPIIVVPWPRKYV